MHRLSCAALGQTAPEYTARMVALESEYGHPYHMTLDEYWGWRDLQELRYEYLTGAAFAMSGASRSHNLVAGNCHGLLWNASRGSGCAVTMADMALFLPDSGKVYYPDVMVACEPDGDDRYEMSPCLIVEVLSPSTQRIDRTVKLGEYTSIPTLINYLMISSDPADPFVVQHRRAGDLWVHNVHRADAEVTLTCPEITFRVSDLYE